MEIGIALGLLFILGLIIVASLACKTYIVCVLSINVLDMDDNQGIFDIGWFNSASSVIAVVLGGLFALIHRMAVYLSRVTCSHTLDYSKYGSDFSQFYASQTMIMILVAGLLTSLALIAGQFKRQSHPLKWLQLFMIGYYLIYILLAFMPASLFVLFFYIPDVLSWSFDFFITSVGITDIDRVYSLANDVKNPELSLDSDLLLFQYMMSSSANIVLCIALHKIISAIRASKATSYV